MKNKIIEFYKKYKRKIDSLLYAICLVIIVVCELLCYFKGYSDGEDDGYFYAMRAFQSIVEDQTGNDTLVTKLKFVWDKDTVTYIIEQK